MLEALFSSAALVALAEIGDKTQLLAILLATRFKKPVPIILGIFFATIANHVLAAWLGAAVSSVLDGEWFRYLVGASFVAMAAWTLLPDKIDDLDEKPPRFGAFSTTLIAFFIVEMGDKTQIATIALGARFQAVIPVTIGTTIGMMLANVPAIYLGHELIKRVAMNKVRMAAATLFLILGLWVIAETAGLL